MSGSSLLHRGVGWVLLGLGVAALAVPLRHPGPDLLPSARNVVMGLAALGLGALLVWPWLGAGRAARVLGAAALAASPFVAFLTLYATLAEVEETVTLRAMHRSGRAADLRLWIVDHEGSEWVTMPRAKAEAHGLDGARLELLRGGEPHCVIATSEDARETVNGIHHLRHGKYAVQRLATAVGLFGRDAGPDVVALRLEPCPD